MSQPLRRLVALPVAMLAVVASLAAVSPASGADAGTPRPCDRAALAARLRLPGVTVAAADPVTSGGYTPPGAAQPVTGLPPLCAVTVREADGAGNVATVSVWLPVAWNGRFQGVGGGGYSCTVGFSALTAAARGGYATATTDCAHTGSALDGGFALTPDGELDRPLIRRFASTGVHGMTAVGKTLTAAFYRRPPAYSYFNGCSTGGRQGLMEAQRYPADYDGVLAGAPAINWTRFIPAELWPQLVMKESGDVLPPCKLAAFTQAAVAACDARDGVTDGVIGDPMRCRWNPAALVGTATACGTITAGDAAVVAAIWRGPVTRSGHPLWFGLTRGTDFSGLARTATVDGATVQLPFPIPVAWLGTWLRRDPAWDWTTLTRAEFERLFRQSVRELSGVIATDDPDLSAFARHGGKVLIWHGLSDSLIFPQGTVHYYERVQAATGGPARTASFARLFLAPGAEHCRQGAGPAPTDPLAALVAWVERGRAPATLRADLVDPATGAVTRSRILCPYPAQARWTGRGSPDDARTFTCTTRHT
jgi:hypothetical protein